MPLYEYQCDACGHRFEIIRRFSDPPLEICPKCGGAVRKLQSAPAFHLKGSGWYITDYGRKDQPADQKDPAKSEGKTESKTEGKTDAKADTKAETKTETTPAPAASESKPSTKDS